MPTPERPKQEPTHRLVLQSLGAFAFGRLGWLVGAPLLVLACGMLVLWWSYVEQSRALYDVEGRATQRVDARLVERFYLLERTDLSTLPSHSVCPDLCQVSLSSIVAYEFEDAAGRTHRVEFRDAHAHDWQHNTAYELGVPAVAVSVRLDPGLKAWMQATRATSHYETTLWDLWWGQFDNAAHWLLRVREPVPQILSPLRYDPADPATAILDVPKLKQRQHAYKRDVVNTAWLLPVFVAVFCLLLLWPAVQMMTHGLPKWFGAAVSVFIVLSVPWWAPAATRIAPMLSDIAGDLAQGMSREFSGAGPYRPNFLAWPERVPAGLATIPWSLESSADAAFVRGVDLRPVNLPPLDHAGALDALQGGLAKQLAAMDDAGVLAALEPLNHYQAERMLELFVPALLALERDQARSAAVRAQATKLLAFFVHDWDLPDVDVFLYEQRLDRYEKITTSATPAIAREAKSKLAAARAQVARQEATY